MTVFKLPERCQRQIQRGCFEEGSADGVSLLGSPARKSAKLSAAFATCGKIFGCRPAGCRFFLHFWPPSLKIEIQENTAKNDSCNGVPCARADTCLLCAAGVPEGRNAFSFIICKGGRIMTLVTNGRLITRDPEGRGYYVHGTVAYEGTKIVEVGEEAALKAKYPKAEIIDAKGGVIMPAFINAHTHIYSRPGTGPVHRGQQPHQLYEVLDGTWWAIDRHLMMEGTPRQCHGFVYGLYQAGRHHHFRPSRQLRRNSRTLHTIAEESKRLGSAPACATRSATGTARKNASRPFRRTPTSSRSANSGRTPCWRLCSAATLSSPFPTRPLTAWWRQQRPYRLPYPCVRGHERCLRFPAELWPPPGPASAGPRYSGTQDHSGPLHPREHRRNGDHCRDRHHGGEQPGEQHGQRHRHLPGASALQAGHSAGHGHRRLHQRHAGIPESGPLLPAEPELPAQRRLVRGHRHAL